MNAVTVIGKYLFSIAFIVYGLLQLVNAEIMTSEMTVPGGVVWTYVSGLCMLLAGVAILVGKKDAVAAFLLGLLFIVYVFLIHLPNTINTGGADPVATTSLLKDLALSGAAFMYARSAAKDRTTRLT